MGPLGGGHRHNRAAWMQAVSLERDSRNGHDNRLEESPRSTSRHVMPWNPETQTRVEKIPPMIAENGRSGIIPRSEGTGQRGAKDGRETESPYDEKRKLTGVRERRGRTPRGKRSTTKRNVHILHNRDRNRSHSS